MITVSRANVQTGAFRLRDVSFDIPSGAFGIVVGAAGSGKTTLLEAIAGVRVLESGAVHLHQHNVTTWPPEKRGVGLVYQRGALFPHRSVRANIEWAATDSALETTIAERLGITGLYETPVSALSGGERQLVALARALVRVHSCLDRGEGAVLLLDEPFSALDPRRRMRMRETVHDIHREWKLTTLQVTHDGVDARRADVAVLLDAGTVVQSGAPEAMLRAPARDDVALFLSGVA